MCRPLFIIAAIALAIFLIVTFTPVIYDTPSSVAYAQGAFGKKQKGDADERRQEEEKKAQERKEVERQEQARQEAAKREAERQQAQREEQARQEAARREAERREQVQKEEQARQESTRREAARQQAEREEKARQEAARQEAERQQAVRQEAQRREAEAQQAKQRESERLEAQKAEQARQETAGKETERQQAADQSSQTSSESGTKNRRDVVDAGPVKVRDTDLKTDPGDFIRSSERVGDGAGDRRVPGNDDSPSTSNSSDRRHDIDAKPVIIRSDRSDRDYDEFQRVGERTPERKPRRHYRPPHPYDYYDDRIIVIEVPREPDWVSVDVSVRQALDRICRAWEKREPEWLLALLPAERMIKILKNDEYTKSIKPAEYYQMTAQAIRELDTEKYTLEIIKQRWNKVTAKGVHVYRDADGELQRVAVNYTLVLDDGYWIISQVGYYIDESLEPWDQAGGGPGIYIMPSGIHWLITFSLDWGTPDRHTFTFISTASNMLDISPIMTISMVDDRRIIDH